MNLDIPYQWHRVADDPPPEGQLVLVEFEDEVIHTARRRGNRYELPPTNLTRGDGQAPIAWLPLD